MPKAYNPDIVAPAFLLTTNFPGATATQVQELVTRPLEDALSELPAIDQLISHSFDGGRSVVTVQFVVGTSTEKAKISLSQKLKDNLHKKPIGAEDPALVTLDPEDVPIISIALTSESRSPQALQSLAFDLADELKLVEGTSKVSVVGGLSDNLQVELIAEKLAHSRLSVADVIGALKNSSSTYTVEPLKNQTGTAILRVHGGISSASAAEQIVLIPDQENPLLAPPDCQRLEIPCQRAPPFGRQKRTTDGRSRRSEPVRSQSDARPDTGASDQCLLRGRLDIAPSTGRGLSRTPRSRALRERSIRWFRTY